MMPYSQNCIEGRLTLSGDKLGEYATVPMSQLTDDVAYIVRLWSIAASKGNFHLVSKRTRAFDYRKEVTYSLKGAFQPVT